MKRLLLGAFTAGALLLAGCGGGGTIAPAPLAQPPNGAASDFQRGLSLGHFAPACDAGGADEARCFAYLLTAAGRAEALTREALSGERTISATSVSGYGPAQLQAAYGTASAAECKSAATSGRAEP